jgi:nucleoside-diphosphate-sugar epimerase
MENLFPIRLFISLTPLLPHSLTFFSLHSSTASLLADKPIGWHHLLRWFNFRKPAFKKQMRVLVTGGSGYLGAHICQRFDADDYSRHSGFDILHRYDARKVTDYDVVIHLAAHLDKSPEEAEECFRVNTEGTVNVLQNMKPDAVLIYASTKDVYGAFADEYEEAPETCRVDYCGQSALEWSKLIGEKYVEFYSRQKGFRSCIFRMSTVYAKPLPGAEPNFVAHYVEAVKYGEPLRLPAQGRPVRDILHVDDFAAACQAFIDSPVKWGLYNIGGGRENAISLSDLVQRIADLMQCNAVVDEQANLPAPVPMNYVTDLTRIRQDLNWQPAIGIDEGLKSLF